MNSRRSLAFYLYCITTAENCDSIAGKGIDGAPLVQVPHRGLTAVVSEVQGADFDAQFPGQRLGDASWVAERAVKHQEVVGKIFSSAPVLPARFGTLFESKDRIAEWLTEYHDRIVTFLDRVRDSAEWSLKGFLDRDEAERRLALEAVEAESGRLDEISPGARYFEQKKIEQRAKARLDAWIDDLRAGIGEAVQAVAEEGCSNSLISRRATGKEEDMVFNFAFRVHERRVPELDETIEGLRRRYSDDGLFFVVSGPWPPYSFCPNFESENS